MVEPALLLRTARPEDAGDVAVILADSYPGGMASHYPPEVLTAALPIICQPHAGLLAGGTYFIATLNGDPAGCGGWSKTPPGTSRKAEGLAHIRHFAVRQSAMGHGVGRALYERCAFEAKMLGCTEFEVESSLNAEGFYSALGFRAIKQGFERFAGVPFAFILMGRAL